MSTTQYFAKLFSVAVCCLVMLLGMSGCQQDGDESAVEPAATSDSAPADSAPNGPVAEGPAASDESSGVPAAGAAPIDSFEQISGWKDAKLLLVMSGAQHGYLEPCGCAGLDKMKGGLGRRHTLLTKMEKFGPPVLALDTGDLVKRAGAQAVIKYQRSIDSLLTMKYQAVGFGLSDLRLQPTDLIATVPADDRRTPFVSANVGLFELGDDTISARFRVFEFDGLKLGVTSVLADEAMEELQNPDLALVDPEEALREVVPKLEAANCDRLLLLVTGELERAEELSAAFPQFDFVVAAGDSDPPPPDVAEIEGSTGHLIELSHKGMYVGVLGFFDDEKKPFRYQRLAIDHRFKDSEDMKAMLAAYQDQLQTEGFKRLGIFSKPAPHDGKFVGSQACQQCHEEEYDVWKESGHAHAMDTLTHLKPPRHFDPECISCHVVGWEPQQYAPFDTGYESLEKTPHLVAVGCENCLGPGNAHVTLEKAAEEGDVDEERQDELYEQMRVTIAHAKENTCIRCHDLDNSPDFEFDKYWQKIEH